MVFTIASAPVPAQAEAGGQALPQRGDCLLTPAGGIRTKRGQLLPIEIPES